MKCNNSFSLDEQYLACLIECAVCGSADPHDVSRPKIKRILAEHAALGTLLKMSGKTNDSGNMVWEAAPARVQNVLIKLARGHIAYELNLPKIEELEQVTFVPFVTMSNEQLSEFESPDNGFMTLWPEIGSRAFIRAAKQWPNAPSSEWIIVQPGRYRYLVSQTSNDVVQIVLSEYLACRVVWS